MKSKLINPNKLTFWEKVHILFSKDFDYLVMENEPKRTVDEVVDELKMIYKNKGLPHYKNSLATMQKWEPAYCCMFSVNIDYDVPDKSDLNFINDQLMNVDFDINSFDDIEISFNENVDENNELVTLPTLFTMKECGYKENSKITIQEYNRRGDIIIEYRVSGVELTEFIQKNRLDYSDPDIREIRTFFSWKKLEVLYLKNGETKTYTREKNG